MGKSRHRARSRRTGRPPRWAWFATLILIGALAYVGYNCYLRLVYSFPYREVIGGAAQKYQLDPYLLAGIIQVESHFNPRAVSSKGAVGLMQIVPETAAWILQARGEAAPANGSGSLRSRLLDPEFNIDLGSWYLRELLDEFGQNEAAALAAYNGGRGNVRSWMEKGLWTGRHEDANSIPFAETREYVRRVMASRAWYMRLYGNRAENDPFSRREAATRVE